MASKRIKGITIEIGHETTGLEKALKDVNKESVNLSKELRDVEKLLKFDPGNVVALAQKQELLTKQVENTTERLNRLKEAEQQVQQQFERGDIGEEQYRAFRREIEFTEGTLEKYKKQLSDIASEQQNLEKATQQLNRLFEVTGKSVDDFADVLGTRLVQQIKDGKANSQQLEVAINKIGTATLGSRKDLDKLKQALDSIDDGKSIENVRKDLEKLSQDAGEAKSSVQDLGNELAGLAGGAAAGLGIAEIIEQSLNTAGLDTKIEISMEIPEESKAAVKDTIYTVNTYIGDQEAAIEGVRRQWALNADASDEANRRIIEGAAAITKAYNGIDFIELIQETNEISRELNISNEEALGLVNALLKIGFPPEQLDIIAEYGQQLQRAGYDAESIQAIMAAGVETGTWNIDNLLDGLKEGRIRLAEFGQEVPKATAELLENTNISTKQLQEWGRAVAKGGEEGHTAMQKAVQALAAVKDETTKNALGIQIFGTMWEDQGENIIKTLTRIDENLKTTEENQDLLNKSIDNLNADPAIQMNKALSDMKVALEPVLSTIASIISNIATWIQQNPQFAASIAAIVSVLGILLGIATALSPLIMALGLGFGGMIAPIAAVVAGIGALIAIFVLFKNEIIAMWNEHIKPVFDSVIGFLTETFQPTFNTVFDSISTIVKDTWEIIQRLWNEILSPVISKIVNILEFFLKPAFIVVFNAISSVVSDAFKGIKHLWENVLKPILNGIIDFISGVFSANWQKAWDGVKRIFEGVFNGLKAAVKAPINAVISIINGFIQGLNKLKVPDWVPVIGGKGINIPEIPKLAKGGVVSEPTLAMVGDAGLGNPEIVAPEKMLRQIMRDTIKELQPSPKQPIILQLVTPDFRELASWLVDDITELQNFKQNRINLFEGR
jgi:phage-related minor tail protein